MALVSSIGFPTGGGGGGGCCCGGGGGGGGGGCCMPCCGRKKREVVMPHFKSSEVPCPQIEWRELMNSSVVSGDAISSLTSIQTALHNRFGHNNNSKFLVNCAIYQEKPEQIQTSAIATLNEEKIENSEQNNFLLPQNMYFSSSGDGYCNVRFGGVWCQAVALRA
uniref:Uncharacterized protein n=1 Tax=Meloidogyne incognita TaxID=6306 RepID=A0A914KNZ7_MELIC